MWSIHRSTFMDSNLLSCRGGSARFTRRWSVAVHATSSKRSHRPSKRDLAPTRERVLRYPDGVERRIRYPVLDSLDESDSNDVSSLWDDRQDHVSDAQTCIDQSSSASLASPSAQMAAQDVPQTMDQQMQFLESLFAASASAYESSAVDRQQLTSTSYEVLEHCPWVLPRKLFVLVKQSMGSSTGNMYSLRTKISTPGASSDLAKALGRGHSPDFLDVSELRDGVLAFASDSAALQYADDLELQGGTQVSVLEMDSHYLFRNTVDAKAVVVHLPGADFVPHPHELASALKSHKPWDEL